MAYRPSVTRSLPPSTVMEESAEFDEEEEEEVTLGSLSEGLAQISERFESKSISRQSFQSVGSETIMSKEIQQGHTKSALELEEDRWMRVSKMAIMTGLLMLALGWGGVLYFLAKRADKSSFEDEFDVLATGVTSHANLHLEEVVESLETLGVSLTSHATGTNRTWPFVTLPSFELQTQQLRQRAGAKYVHLDLIVYEDDKDDWEAYSEENQWWIQEGLDFQGDGRKAEPISPFIYKYSTSGRVVPDNGPANPYYVVPWQIAPAPQTPTVVNFNSMSSASSSVYLEVDKTRDELMTSIQGLTSAPFINILAPVFFDITGAEGGSELAGFLTAVADFDTLFDNLLPGSTPPLYLVVSNSCGQVLTYMIAGTDVDLLSNSEDVHDTQYDKYEFTSDLQLSSESLGSTDPNGYYCVFEISVYPTTEFYESYATQRPRTIYIGVIVIAFFTAGVFMTYDYFVTRRQKQAERQAALSGAIVSSLFPEQVRERLLQNKLLQEQQEKKRGKGSIEKSTRYAGNAEEAHGEEETAKLLRTKPIADLFPSASVMFGDVCGFSAWSSVREPAQVFTLLEHIYNSFDTIAQRRRIFKVETIGDCYVAACGLPDPRPDHAVAITRFAVECLSQMQTVLKSLEVTLGPGTEDLTIRIGIHSGAVTAGVLRGEKSRFQLFGDTMNTASRMETTGERGRIHVSDVTAKMLVDFGKKHWLVKRPGGVQAKGKGTMETFWITMAREKAPVGPTSSTSSNPKEFNISSVSIASDSENSTSAAAPATNGTDNAASNIAAATKARIDSRNQRLVEWNRDVLSGFLKKILAMRLSEGDSASGAENHTFEEAHGDSRTRSGTVLDEVQEIVGLPQKHIEMNVDTKDVTLPPDVKSQLHSYVSLICGLYNNNSFHNFEHASHVTQSVSKLLTRVVTADDIDFEDLRYTKKTNVAELHTYTFGITSDPITQFACAFSALIHDVDHQGVPNNVLVKEATPVASLYNNKSVAEQNSVDVAWSLLLEDRFKELRRAIYRNEEEFERFRQLVVNSVMATDIADKELGHLRKERWNKAFSESSSMDADQEDGLDSINRKATIVIEYLIQASDVSHTMQHWHVYLKWNERLFHEMYAAYKEGRSDSDPAKSWYKGELGFFDFYVIPLAHKLKECGVFGVSGDEYLQYAKANRDEWETKGETVVEGYMSKYIKSEHEG
eukprot:Nitzschia sp. Nitz4//scaffold24_size164493//84634//88676//NITZ4_002330-RA/size164493-augustus-gene-0.260-mRNA-1//1//CDS//3329544120//3518//frame0